MGCRRGWQKQRFLLGTNFSNDAAAAAATTTTTTTTTTTIPISGTDRFLYEDTASHGRSG